MSFFREVLLQRVDGIRNVQKKVLTVFDLIFRPPLKERPSVFELSREHHKKIEKTAGKRWLGFLSHKMNDRNQ